AVLARVPFFFQAEDGIRDFHVTGVQTCALPIWVWGAKLAASLTFAAAALVALLLLGFGLLYLVAATNGQVGELDGPWWEESLGVLGRTAAMGLGMTGMGSALARLGRHTAIGGGVIAGD